MIPVLFKIDFHGSTGLFSMSSDYTAFPHEREVLVQDGLQYKVLGQENKYDADSDKRYVIVEMEYPFKQEADNRISSYLKASMKGSQLKSKSCDQ